MKKTALAAASVLAGLVLIGAIVLILLPRGSGVPETTTLMAAENVTAPSTERTQPESQPAPEQTQPQSQPVPAQTQPAPAESTQLAPEETGTAEAPQTAEAQTPRSTGSYTIRPTAPAHTAGYHAGREYMHTREYVYPTAPPLPGQAEPAGNSGDPEEGPFEPAPGDPMPGAGAIAYGVLTPPPEKSVNGIVPDVLLGDDGLALPIFH